jgi:hypothetical protein
MSTNIGNINNDKMMCVSENIPLILGRNVLTSLLYPCEYIPPTYP